MKRISLVVLILCACFVFVACDVSVTDGRLGIGSRSRALVGNNLQGMMHSLRETRLGLYLNCTIPSPRENS